MAIGRRCTDWPLALAAALALASTLGGCLVSGSIGSGGARGGISIGTGGTGVTISGGSGGVSVGVGTRTGGSSPAPRERGGGETAGGALMRKPLADGRLTSRFGPRRGRAHNGIDYAAARGTAVYAAGDGVVASVRRSASFGNHVRIRHSGELVSGYAHLAAFAEGLREGVRVRRGQIIGAVGETGRASGPHLHYEVLRNGRYVDPLGESLALR